MSICIVKVLPLSLHCLFQTQVSSFLGSFSKKDLFPALLIIAKLLDSLWAKKKSFPFCVFPEGFFSCICFHFCHRGRVKCLLTTVTLSVAWWLASLHVGWSGGWASGKLLLIYPFLRACSKWASFKEVQLSLECSVPRGNHWFIYWNRGSNAHLAQPSFILFFSRPICACKLSLVPLKCQCGGVSMYLLAMDLMKWTIFTSPSIHSLLWYAAIINFFIFQGVLGSNLLVDYCHSYGVFCWWKNQKTSTEVERYSCGCTWTCLSLMEITSHYYFVLYFWSVFQWNVLHTNELLQLFSPVLVIAVLGGGFLFSPSDF